MSEKNYGLRCASCMNMGEPDHDCFPAVPKHAQIPPLTPYQVRVQEGKEKLRAKIENDIKSIALGQMGLSELLHKIPRWYSLWKYEPYRGHQAMFQQSTKSGRLFPQT